MMKTHILTLLFLLAGLAGMAQEKVMKGTGLTVDSVIVVNRDYSWENAVGSGRTYTPVDADVTVQWSIETGHIRFKSGDGWTDWYKLVKDSPNHIITTPSIGVDAEDFRRRVLGDMAKIHTDSTRTLGSNGWVTLYRNSVTGRWEWFDPITKTYKETPLK